MRFFSHIERTFGRQYITVASNYVLLPFRKDQKHQCINAVQLVLCSVGRVCVVLEQGMPAAGFYKPIKTTG